MKKSLHLLAMVFVLGIAGLAGCQSVKVQSDYDETVDFARYNTFAWMPEPSGAQRSPQINAVMDNRIKRAIEHELEMDGLQKNTTGRPDVYVVYHTAVQRKLGPAYLARYGYDQKTGMVRRESYQEGTLIIDLVDAGQKALIWRGAATGAVNNLSRTEKKLFGAVERIFAEFPPADS